MLRLARFFFSAPGANPWIVVGCLFVAEILQGLSVLSLVPLISMVGGEGADNPLAGWLPAGTAGLIGAMPGVGVLLIAICLLALGKAGMTILAMRFVGRAVADVVTGLRVDLSNRLLHARWGYFVGLPAGHVLNAMTIEASRTSQSYLLTAKLAASMIAALISFAVAFVISWQIAVAAILIGGFLFVFLRRFLTMSRRAGERVNRHLRSLVQQIGELLLGMKPIKAMAREDEYGRLLRERIARVGNATRREILSAQILSNLQEPVLVISLALGAYILLVPLETPIAQIIVVGLLLQRTVKSVAKIQSQFQDAAANEPAFASFRAFVADAALHVETTHGQSPPALQDACRFEKVSYAYGDRTVLDEVSLEIPARKLTLLVGPSGAGKTTLADLLLGLDRPAAGRISIDGVDLAGIDLRAWRRRIGYVPQDLNLLHDTILANVTLGDPSLGGDAARRALEKAGAWEFVRRLPGELDFVVGERGGRLSGGQRQRLAIARAIVHEPALLILDEVTSALDAANEREICRLARQLCDSVTILAISHRGPWTDIADRIWRVEHGRLTRLEPADAALT